MSSGFCDFLDFNPHPRTEGDEAAGELEAQTKHFNPHPRTEGDSGCRYSGQIGQISTHTLARRVTRLVSGLVDCGWISTHTLARRVTKAIDTDNKMEGISTHTLARRVTIFGGLKLQPGLFQPTPSHGG